MDQQSLSTCCLAQLEDERAARAPRLPRDLSGPSRVRGFLAHRAIRRATRSRPSHHKEGATRTRSGLSRPEVMSGFHAEAAQMRTVPPPATPPSLPPLACSQGLLRKPGHRGQEETTRARCTSNAHRGQPRQHACVRDTLADSNEGEASGAGL